VNRFALSIAACAAVVVVAPGQSAAAGPASDSCRDRGQTIVATPDVRVFAMPSRRGRDFGDRVYACLYASRYRRGVTRRLGFFNPVGSATEFIVASRFVAYERLLCSESECSGEVRVTDVRRGTSRRSAHFTGMTGAVGLVVTPQGAAAWMRGVPSTGFTELRKMDADGEAVLDAGPSGELDPESLAAGARTIYWQHGGQTRSSAVR
jgi:hypothetical protein